MESQPQNPEFWNNPENFHPCRCGQTEETQKAKQNLGGSGKE